MFKPTTVFNALLFLLSFLCIAHSFPSMKTFFCTVFDSVWLVYFLWTQWVSLHCNQTTWHNANFERFLDENSNQIFIYQRLYFRECINWILYKQTNNPRKNAFDLCSNRDQSSTFHYYSFTGHFRFCPYQFEKNGLNHYNPSFVISIETAVN